MNTSVIKEWRALRENRDVKKLESLLADDVELYTPIIFGPPKLQMS